MTHASSILGSVVFHTLVFVSRANTTMQAVAPHWRFVMNQVEKEEQEQHGQKKQVTIIVKARPHMVAKEKICFAEVVALSGLPGGESVTFTVTYRRGDGHKPEGS